MKAIQIRELGEDPDLRLVEIPEPRPGAGEVLVDVKAAGVNYADVLMCRGRYGGRRPLPFVPGFEAAGVVTEVGRGVENWRPGQRVMGTVLRETCGCYAEKAVMPAWLLLPVPQSLSFEEAAAFPEVFITAYLALHVFGRLTPGETVLIHAAAGGVGTAAVQIARAAGARVIATASSEEKLLRVRGLGAEVLINYATQDFLDEVKKQTDGRGVDLVLESVGGEVFEKSVQCLRPLGRLITYGTSSGSVGALKTTDLQRPSLSVGGFSFGALSISRPDVVRQVMAAVEELLAQRRVRPVVGHRLPLAEARAAQNLLASRGNFGKVILIP